MSRKKKQILYIMNRARKIYSYSMALLIMPLAISALVAIGAIGIWIAIAKSIMEHIDEQ